jgi:prepilin-type N-terminal cleavage/methylation domain-containing protein
MRPSSRKGGFTLIELMAALVAGLVAISAIYAVSSGSARHFQEQQRIAQTQMSLRMAMAQLRADIQRAGLYGTGNSAVANPPNLQGCPQPSPIIQAVEQLDSADDAVFQNFVTDNAVEFDRLRLVGNYATTGSYLMTGAVNSNQIRLQDTWQGFRRDFIVNDGTNTVSPAFAAAFAANRYLHIRTLQGTSVFTPISLAVSDGDVRVNVASPMPIASPCMPGLGDGATVAPLSRIEYAVVNPATDAQLAPLVNTNPATDAVLGLTPSVLVRREITFGAAPTVVANTTRVVLEYVADFSVRFVVDTNPTAANPTLTVLDGTAFQALGRPEDVRSVIVRLSVRTPGTQPQFAAPTKTRTAAEPLTRFVVRGAQGAARVRTVETEIFLPNLVPAPR